MENRFNDNNLKLIFWVISCNKELKENTKKVYNCSPFFNLSFFRSQLQNVHAVSNSYILYIIFDIIIIVDIILVRKLKCYCGVLNKNYIR